MKGYLLAAAGVIFLTVIVSLIVPEGKLNKSITFVMRLVCIAVLVQPVTKIFTPAAPTAGDLTDYGYISEMYSMQQSESLEVLIKEKFGVDAECSVTVKYESDKITADTVSAEINCDDEKIIAEIYEYLSESGYINISITTVYAQGS